MQETIKSGTSRSFYCSELSKKQCHIQDPQTCYRRESSPYFLQGYVMFKVLSTLQCIQCFNVNPLSQSAKPLGFLIGFPITSMT